MVPQLQRLTSISSDGSSDTEISVSVAGSSGPLEDSFSSIGSISKHRCISQPKCSADGNTQDFSYHHCPLKGILKKISSNDGVVSEIRSTCSIPIVKSDSSSDSTASLFNNSSSESSDKSQGSSSSILGNIRSIFGNRSSEDLTKQQDEQRPFGEQRCVRFGCVSIREHEIIIGTNPAVTEGPAISLGWRYNDTVQRATLNKYEKYRYFARRSVKDLEPVSSIERTRRLIEWGVTCREFTKTMKEIDKVKRNREKTLKQIVRNKKLKSFFTHPGRGVKA